MALPPLSPDDIRRIQPKLLQCMDIVRPEAKELAASAMQSLSTKNGYGSVLATIGRSEFPASMKAAMLAAMIEEGYPSETAGQVAELLGIVATYERFRFIVQARNVYETEPTRA